MSSIAAIAAFGPPHRNSGAPVRVTLLGTLHVGGSGVWDFRRMTGEPFRVSLRSSADIASELLAGYALSGLDEQSDDAVDRLLGAGWWRREVDVEAPVVAELAGLVADVPMGVFVSETGRSTTFRAEDWESTAWSVTFAAEVDGRAVTQWG